MSELSRRIRDAERSVKRLVADYDEEHDEHGDFVHHHETTDVESGRHNHSGASVADDGGSDDDDDDRDPIDYDSDEPHSLEAIEEEFRQLEDEVATLVADVHDLALYTKVSLISFPLRPERMLINSLLVFIAQLYWVYEDHEGMIYLPLPVVRAWT